MTNRWIKVVASGVLLLGFSFSWTSAVAEPPVTPVPKLDLNRFTGVWYEIAHYPNKREKRCLSDITVLYALGDKANTFQTGTFCKVKGGHSDEIDDTGKMDKSGSGKLKFGRFWPFSFKVWVLATGPSYEWALIGSPNHKLLSVLSRTAVLPPDVFAEIQAKAAAEGFDTSKLAMVPQHH